MIFEAGMNASKESEPMVEREIELTTLVWHGKGTKVLYETSLPCTSFSSVSHDYRDSWRFKRYY